MIELEVGAPAHGGHCVARHLGQVVFVRHALPGERVIASVTEEHKGYLRADAVKILRPSPGRVTAPCPYSHPGGCGGCDLQHASLSAQLEWKADVLEEQLRRLTKITRRVPVEPLPGDGYGWRTRVRYRVAAAGYAGLLKHRSNEVVPIDRCLIAHPSIQDLPVLSQPHPDVDVIDVVAPSGGPAQIVGAGGEVSLGGSAVPAGRRDSSLSAQRITEHAVNRDFDLAASAFWQVHPAAADTLAQAVVDFLAPRPGESAWDLYGGAGLFSAALGCPATLVEASHEGAEAARRSLADLPVTVIQSTVERARLRGPVDLVVLDPPRTGAGARVVRMIDQAGPRAVAYVACDPAALARDLRTFLDLGWELGGLRAFDCFPQTHHFETVALVTRSG